MTWSQSRRIAAIQTPVIPVVGEWIKQHPGTISLGQGVVHYGPPPGVAEAVASAANGQQLHRYGLVRGTDDFLEAAAQKLRAENGLPLYDASVVCTPGSNMGFVNAVLAIADVGDEIILLSPYYFNHEMAVGLAACEPVIVPTDAQYQLDLQRIEQAITPRTRAIVTVSPNNPTGAVYSAADLTAVNQLCRERGLFHISDEAYEYFTFPGETPHFSPGSLPDSEAYTISLYSLSKAYGMAGWRVAYMVVPQHLETAVKKIQDTQLVCPPLISQVAGCAALAAGRNWCEPRIQPFRAVRELVIEQLETLGDRCDLPHPAGAFYVLAQLDTDQSDLQLVEQLIRDFGVAVMPGSTFGVAADRCSIRVAFGALEAGTVADGIGRLVRGLNRLL
ncbi:MAG: pyridoxal phosphate-dependent aminotransferase [Planctomycetales bacterium]|nr:pyridoxal phosphate-dependent aminotransferase [Planctomycetales bacterium]